VKRKMPDRRAMEQALRARREALQRKLSGKLSRKLSRKKPARKRPPEKDRRRWWLLLLILILLLLWALLQDCGGEEPAVAALPRPGTPVQLEPAPEPPAPEPPPPPVARRERPAFDSEPPEVLPWITSFRMQVAARSPRLAECFVGVERPGRLKWTAAVEPTHGHVSDHSLEPMLQSDALTQQQRECVLSVLSAPPYRLEPGEGRSTPSRVGLVIEF
jgi:hypothetical protein